MKIAVLGTGMVGQTISSKLAELGHDVVIGTRNVEATLAKTEVSPMGTPPLASWLEQHSDVNVATFDEAAAHGELIMLASAGLASVKVLAAAGAHIDGKIIIDITNALDFSQGFPPALGVCNTDSVGEQLQREFPGTKIVKALNTVSAPLMINPRQLADGEHHLFVCGNDADAKAQVTTMLVDWLGWKHVLDLGDITNARATEMYLPLWLRLFGTLNTPMLNIQVMHAVV